MTDEIVEANPSEEGIREVEGDAISPDKFEKIFKTYQEAIDFLDWRKPRQATITRGTDQHNNSVVQVIYIR